MYVKCLYGLNSIKTYPYTSGSQTGRRKTLPGAPRKHVKVAAFTTFLTKIAM